MSDGSWVTFEASPGETDAPARETFYGYVVGDFDGDGADELYCPHESFGAYGNSFGCLNDVYEYDGNGGVVLARRAITSFVPDYVSFYGTGYLRLENYATSGDARTYMPVSDAYATGYLEIPETDYLSIEPSGNEWHLLTCSAFAVDGDVVVDQAEHDRLVSVYEGSSAQEGLTGTMSYDDIDQISTEV